MQAIFNVSMFSGLFAPSCISHTMLIKKNWNQIKLNGVSLQDAIKCWELKQTTTNFDKMTSSLLNTYQRRMQLNTITNEVEMISPSLHSNSFQYPNAYSNVFNFRETNSIFDKLYGNRKRKERTQRRQHRSYLNDDSPIDEVNLAQCSVRLVDDCTFPQCNQQCPNLKNLFTGKAINFFDLLKAFGVKMRM